MRTPALFSPRPRGLAGLTAAALIASPLALGLAPAGAVSPNIVISEVYGGGGNSGAVYNRDFVELYNPTASSVSLAGLSLQGRAATGGSAGAVLALTGSIPAGGTYVVATSAAGANGAALPSSPPQSASWTLGATGGQVLLVNGTTTFTGTGDLAGNAALVDMLGWGTTGAGAAATSFETAAAGVTSNSTSIARTKADADNNSAEFAAQTPTPDAANIAAPAALDAQSPGDRSGVVGSAIAGFTLTATGGTAPYKWTAAGLPPGVTVAENGDVSGTPTTAGTYNVVATVTDSASTPGSDTVSFTFTVTEPGGLTSIAEIQGTGATTPKSGQTVTTRGVVTASYPTGGLNGFYIQTPGADTPDASDAIFVYGGPSGFVSYPAVGDSVEVTGTAGEFSNATQITASGVTAVPSLGTVTPKTQIPGTDCALPGTACLEGAALDAAREVVEGELFKPTAPWTVTDAYDGSPDLRPTGGNDGAFIGELAVVANSEDPLVAPTEIIDAQATAAINDRKRYNAAHRLILDDASSWSYFIPGQAPTHANDPFPWFTLDHTVRVGAGMTFLKPVVFTQRLSSWRILPPQQVVGKPTGLLEFEQTRPAAPQPVGGDVKLATFNVLNFFPTTGEEFDNANATNTCTYFTDRDGNRISNNQCNPNGPRGAANDVNLTRQRDKIVAAINTANADIVSLEELENSVKFGKDRDFAINALVTALNADAGAGTWAAVPSAPTLPPVGEQDVIRNGFIYKPAKVDLVGDSVVLSDQSSAGEAFEDAREPVAQAFKQDGTSDASAFAVIVNHFKSKGSGTPDPDGQGNANDRRELQAAGLVTFADSFKAQRNLSRVFLAGDFNAYSEEDPIQILNDAGYTNLESTSDPEEESYSFDGMVGSLDHVLANGPALEMVTGVDIWDINSYESVYYEYARFNTNVTNLYAPNPYRSSDHNPEIVGLRTLTAPVPPPAPAPGAADTSVVGTSARIVYGQPGSVAIKVTPGTATGTVRLTEGKTLIGTATLAGGAATIALPATSLKPGTHTLAISYPGDAEHKASYGSVDVTVVKAEPRMKIKVKPERIVAGVTKARIVVKVRADGFVPTGKVRVRIAGTTYKVPLRDGKGFVMMTLDKPRTYVAKIRYSGDRYTEAGSRKQEIAVKRR